MRPDMQIAQRERLPIQPDFQENLKSFLRKHADGRTEEIFSMMASSGNLTETEKAVIAHQVSLRRNASGTQKMYLAVTLHFFKYAQVQISEIRPYHIEDWMVHLKARGLKATTLSTQLSVIKAFFKYLHAVGMMRMNPSTPVKGPKFIPHYHGEKVLMLEDVEKLIAYARRHACVRDFLLCRLLAGCGMRVSECVSLTWRDLTQDVRGRWYAKVLGKGEKVRHIYVPGDVMKEILEWRQARFGVVPGRDAPALADLPLFARPGDVTHRISTVTAYKAILECGQTALGKKISPHWLRHTFATHARLAGATIEQIREQLGHESYQTTMRYEHSQHLMEPAGAVLEKAGSTAEWITISQ